MNTMFHAEKSDFASVSDDSAMSKSSELVGSKDSSQKLDSYRVDDIGLFHAQDELEFAISPNQIYDQQCVKEFVDDLYSDIVSPPFQSCEDEAKTAELIEPKKRRHHVFPTESFEILRKYGSRRLKLDVKSSSTSHEMQSDTTLSTETIIRVAAEKFIQSMSESSNELSMLNHPYPSYLLAHSGKNSEGVQLIQNLLSCAEKVADNQYERALKFLKECDKKSFRLGTPIQRLVFYFSRALFEKIANETGRIRPKDLEEKHGDPVESLCCPSMNMLISFHKEHPHSQVTKLVGVQAILDHLKEARKVHVIDLQIRSGVQWTILMQALAARTEHPIQHLKITAVGIKWKSIMDETGRQLTAFAQSLNLEFTFKIVLVENFLDLNHTLFDVVADESVAIYAPYVLATIVGRVDKLDHLMMVMKNMNPCVMIVTELEVNCNSPTFIGRFVESLFFFGAFFDSLGDCFKNDETSRLKAESTWFGSSISNILAAEEDQRKFRHVNINVWRAFFARVGLVEIELSVSSLDQACLGLQSLPYGSSCTLYKDGKCLTLGWKGSPLSSLSAWKFQ
ncbi:hypothetical protein C2S51_026402 [Perilla frutescens var. frutescens]|nr:hypothetical protein C2S51_026402 [Perilla frutescens var. frutescens]